MVFASDDLKTFATAGPCGSLNCSGPSVAGVFAVQLARARARGRSGVGGLIRWRRLGRLAASRSALPCRDAGADSWSLPRARVRLPALPMAQTAGIPARMAVSAVSIPSATISMSVTKATSSSRARARESPVSRCQPRERALSQKSACAWLVDRRSRLRSTRMAFAALQAASGPTTFLDRNGTCSFGQRWHVRKTCRDYVATNNVNSLEEQLR
jgi:hypothetical protein